MSESSSESKKTTTLKNGFILPEGILEYITNAIDSADEEAASKRVQELKQANPDVSVEELVELLIKNKCWQTGGIGAITSSPSIIPGIGSTVALIFGSSFDIGLTFKMNAELVLEIAVAHQHPLAEEEQRNAVLLVTGISAGVNQLLPRAGQKIAEKVTQRLAQKSVAKAIPVIGIAASAGTNALTTYIIGQRAQAYFCLGPEAVGDWGESLRAISGLDERKLTSWLSETTERSWQLVSTATENTVEAVIGVGKSVGEVVVIGGGKAAGKMGQAGKAAIGKTSETVGKVGKGIVKASSNVGDAVGSTAKGVGQTVVGAGEATVEVVGNTVDKAKQGISGTTKKVTGKLARKSLSRKSKESDEEELA